MDEYFRVVEIGATQLRRADVNANNNEVMNLNTRKTREVLQTDPITNLLNFIKGSGLIQETRAIIIAIAGPVEDHKIIKIMPNFPEFPENYNLAQTIGETFSLPVFIYNDMESAVAGMAETLEKTQEFKGKFWGITWSSGVSAKFWDNGITINREPGHEIKIEGKEAEDHLGGVKMAESLNKTLEETTQAFEQDEDWAIDFYEKKSVIMGEFLAELVKIAEPELFCFKGSIALNLFKHEKIKKIVLDSLNKNNQKQFVLDCLVLSPEPDQDGLIGAANLARTSLAQ